MVNKEKIQEAIDQKTKPPGSLGMLEELAFKICEVQQTTSPKLMNPHLLVFAADHGLAKAGVSQYPQEVTAQMVLNFLAEGAAINVFTSQNDMHLRIIDAGVNADFDSYNVDFINQKIAKGTKNALEEPAMTEDQLNQCLEAGATEVRKIKEAGCNVVGFGEMGIGNTSSASLLMSQLLDLSIEECVGAGTGLEEEGISRKASILKDVIAKHEPKSTKDVLQNFGGFEIAQMCGAMMEAYKQNMILLIDGFIASAACLVAWKLESSLLKNCIFCHASAEKGHGLMLEKMEQKPILKLGMRLGEGTGCAVAYPIILSAVNFMNDMATFESAGVSNKS